MAMTNYHFFWQKIFIKRLKNQKGQSMLEYILVMLVVVSALIMVLGNLKKNQFFFKNITEPLVKHLVYNYKYADPKSQGWDEGNPKKHIQISRPNDSNTFRLFQPEK